MCAKWGSGVFFYLFQKEMWLEIFLSFDLLREIGGLKGEVGRCAKWRSGGGDGQWLCQL